MQHGLRWGPRPPALGAGWEEAAAPYMFQFATELREEERENHLALAFPVGRKHRMPMTPDIGQ